MRNRFVLSTLGLTLVLSTQLTFAGPGARYTGPDHSLRSAVYARHGMVATSHPLVTQIGLQVLMDGGNAIDAAIAANAATGLMEPTGSGVGGDLFALIWSADDKKLYALNASGRASMNANREALVAQGLEYLPRGGALSVTVPGAVDGWFMLHERFGSVSMPELLAPAIRYADEGFPLTQFIGYGMKRSLTFFRSRGYPNLEDTYAPDGTWPDSGVIFQNPMLAETLRSIADKGRDGFYSGRIASAIAKVVQDNGGFIDEADLAAQRGEWVEPVSTNYRGFDVWEIPPNGQGIAALQMLNILEQFDFSEVSFGSAEHIHLFTEAKKLAFEDRARYYADPAFESVPVEHLISKAYAKERAALIDREQASTYVPGDLSDHGDTIYLTTADRHGNMVSLIQSNYSGMGSGMVPKGTGFMLHNRGAAFSLKADHKNRLEPGKRPFHTIIPAFVTKDGRPYFSFGVMGGSMQPQGHVQIVMNMVDFGMDPQEAGDAPRIRHSESPTPEGLPGEGRGVLNLEPGFSPAEVRDLKLRRHTIGSDFFYGGYQGILWNEDEGYYVGATESRMDGQAAGY